MHTPSLSWMIQMDILQLKKKSAPLNTCLCSFSIRGSKIQTVHSVRFTPVRAHSAEHEPPAVLLSCVILYFTPNCEPFADPRTSINTESCLCLIHAVKERGKRIKNSWISWIDSYLGLNCTERNFRCSDNLTPGVRATFFWKMFRCPNWENCAKMHTSVIFEK